MLLNTVDFPQAFETEITEEMARLRDEQQHLIAGLDWDVQSHFQSHFAFSSLEDEPEAARSAEQPSLRSSLRDSVAHLLGHTFRAARRRPATGTRGVAATRPF